MVSHLILASSCQKTSELWRQGLIDQTSTISIIDRLDKLHDAIQQTNPQILLLDFDFIGLDGLNGTANLKRLCSEIKIIILSDTISEDIEWELFKVGVRGCCQKNIKPEFLQQIVSAVHRGELWMRRTLTSRLLHELGKTRSKNKIHRPQLALLNKLTQREYDIAVRVGNGESNKQIAESCHITERTVKSHLTEIFNKLGIADRLNLALILSTDARHQRRAKSNG